MKKRKGLLFVVFVSWLLSIGVLKNGMGKALTWPYPLLHQTLWGRYGLIDSVFILMGFRNLDSDIAWIKLLQYTGGPMDPEENPDRPYDFFKPMSLRVVRIDPFNRYARLYAAGFLAWSNNVRRPEEAIEVLSEGIKQDPTYWRYHLYVGAIAYNEKGDIDRMVLLLEEALKYPDCPALVKAVLANIYKERGYYDKAILIWEDIMESEATDYRNRAYRQIGELRELKRTQIKQGREIK